MAMLAFHKGLAPTAHMGIEPKARLWQIADPDRLTLMDEEVVCAPTA